MIKQIITPSRVKIGCTYRVQSTSPLSFKTKHTMLRSPINLRRLDLVKTRISPEFIDGLNTSTYFIGKGIILFTMFYCSMNWAYYRGMRKDLEKENEKKNEKKDKK